MSTVAAPLGPRAHLPPAGDPRLWRMSPIEKVVTIKRLHDRDRDDLRYWRTRPLEERLAQVEELRAYFNGWSDDAARPQLPRVHRVLRRP